MRSVTILVVLAFSSCCTYAQSAPFKVARPGAKGMFILVGDQPAAGKRTAYRVERRDGADKTFRQVAQLDAVTMPENFRLNMASVEQWLPYSIDLTVFKADSIWRKVRAAGTVNVLKNVGYSLPVLAGFNLLWLDTHLVPGQTYQYRITGVGDNYTLLSEEVRYVPEAVAPVQIENHFYDRIRHTLTLHSFAAGEHKPVWLEAWRSDDKGAFENVHADITFRASGDSLRFTVRDTTATPHRLYRYFISSFDALGNRAPIADTLSIASLDPVQVPLPDKVNLEADSVRNSIRLSWNLANAPLINMLRLYRSTNSVDNFNVVAELAPTQTTFTDEGLAPATVYFYYFEVHYKTLDNPGRTITYSKGYRSARPPFPPVEVNAIGNKAGIALSWNNQEIPLKGFHLYRAENDGPFEQISGLIPVRDTVATYAYTDTSSQLNGGRFYHYVVRAVSSSFVEGPPSDTASARPQKNIPVPRAPMEVSLNMTDGKTWVTWDDVAGYDTYVMGYLLLRSRPVKGKSQTDTLLCTTNFYVDSLMKEGETIRYKVISLSALGVKSEPSREVLATVEGPIPAPPGSLTVNAAKRGVQLNWEPPAGNNEMQFVIYRYERRQKPVKLATLPGTTEVFTDTKTVKGRHYFYYIKSLNSSKTEGEKSNEAAIRR